ncbi:MAG: chitobiase/beta-hexosaminidase C-terminal domain-containing protein [Verrucomicrobiota bacterium]
MMIRLDINCLFILLFLHSTVLASKPLWQLEEWSKGRQLVWAKPGKKGALKSPQNWLENGKPAKKAPDRETDIILPAADRYYIVSATRQDQVRHVTIEENAELAAGSRNAIEVWGNVDVKDGGWISNVSIRGDKDTYFNIEESKFAGNGRIYHHVTNKLGIDKRCNSRIAHKFQVSKIGTKSVEFLSNVGVSDEVMLQHGKVIISGDFRYSGATNKGAFEVFDGGILEIQSGGALATMINANGKSVYNVNVYRNGVLQAGSPERPLTEDAYLYLGFANNRKPGTTGLYTALGSFIRVYSKDPEKARLVITSVTSNPEIKDGQGRPMGQKDEKASGRKGIMLQLGGDVKLNGVHFDYLAKGGIGLSDPKIASKWENITYGNHNASSNRKDLISKMKADPNSYYHKRGDQKSEWGMTEMAIKSMNKHLSEYEPFQLKAIPENTQMKKVGEGKEQIKTPIAKIFNDSVEVEIQSKVPGAQIKYTTDGSLPDASSPTYTSPFSLTETSKLTVRAYKKGVGFSPTYTTTYVIE